MKWEIVNSGGEVVAFFSRRHDCVSALIFKYEPKELDYNVQYFRDGSARMRIFINGFDSFFLIHRIRK